MTNQMNELSREPGPGFMTFSLPCDQDTAVLQFEERHGYPPEKAIYFNDKYLMLGPTPEREICLGVDDG